MKDSTATSKLILLSVVIPVFNESETIENTIKNIVLWNNVAKILLEIIIVDDGSTDNSLEKINSLKKEISFIKTISYKPNRGKGYAVRNGILSTKGTHILFMDADNSTEISEVNKLIEECEKGFDIVIGERTGKEKRLFARRLASNMGRLFISSLFFWNIKDSQCGFKLFTKKSANDIFSRQILNGFAFDIEILSIAKLLGYKVAPIYIKWKESKKQSSFKTILHGTKIIIDSINIKYKLLTGFYNH